MNYVRSLSVAALLVGTAVPSLARQTDPSTWMLATPLFGTTTLVEIRPNGTVASYPTAATSTTVVHASNSLVYVNNVTAGSIDYYGAGGTLQASFLATNPSQIGVTPSGTIWVLSSAILASSVQLYAQAGGPVMPAVALPTSFATTELEVDIAGDAWVLNFAPARLDQVTTAGVVTSIPLAATATDIAATSTGGVWLADGTTTVRRYAAGALMNTVTTPTPVTEVAEDGYGNLWLADSATRTLYAYPIYNLPATPLVTIPVPSLTTLAEFQPDTRGGIWAIGTVNATPTAIRLSLQGALLATVTLPGLISAVDGDMTGIEFAVALTGGAGDSDGDGAANSTEFMLGMDPIDVTNVPSTISPPVVLTNPTAVSFVYSDPANPGAPYLIGASAGTSILPYGMGGIPLFPPFGYPAIPLTADAVFTLSTTPGGGGIFNGFIGFLDGAGNAFASVNIPTDVSVGATIYFAGATGAASGVVLSPAASAFVP